MDVFILFLLIISSRELAFGQDNEIDSNNLFPTDNTDESSETAEALTPLDNNSQAPPSLSEGVPNATNTSNTNSTGTKLKPVCTIEQGCVPPLACSVVNASLLNDSHVVGVFGRRGVVNVTSAQLETLLDSPVFTNSCLLVFYYAVWCPYSVEFMPTYNLLGFAFPNDSLTVAALDFGRKDNEKFLLAYIPRVLLYYSGRAVFDMDISLSIDNLTSILSNMTGLMPLTRERNNTEEGESDGESFHIEWEFDSTWYYLSLSGIGLIIIVHLLKRTSFFNLVAKLRDAIRNLVSKIKTD